jgi:hypothetical protein
MPLLMLVSLGLPRRGCARQLKSPRGNTVKNRTAYAQIEGGLGKAEIRSRKCTEQLEHSAEVLSTHGPSFHKQLPSVLIHLTQVDGRLGMLKKARETARHAYDMDLSVYCPDHPETAFDLDILRALGG